MLRPRRFEHEIDPGPIQIQARKVHFDATGIPLDWIPGHPVASNVVSLLNVVLPAAERWFVQTYNDALPLVKDPQLADEMRGFIGQEATHADVHDQMLREYMVVNGIDPKPMLDQIEFLFAKTLAPTTSTDPKRELNHLCDRLWFIAAIEHYTAVLGDFALNCAWDDYGAAPTMVDLFRWSTFTTATSTGSARCRWPCWRSSCSSSAPPGFWSSPIPPRILVGGSSTGCG